MLSSRRFAQLGLGAACLTLVASVTIVIAGSSETTHQAGGGGIGSTGLSGTVLSAVANSSPVAPLASGRLGSLQADLSQQIADAKR